MTYKVFNRITVNSVNAIKARQVKSCDYDLELISRSFKLDQSFKPTIKTEFRLIVFLLRKHHLEPGRGFPRKLRATGVKDRPLPSGLIRLGTRRSDTPGHSQHGALRGPRGPLGGPAGRLSAHLGAKRIVKHSAGLLNTPLRAALGLK